MLEEHNGFDINILECSKKEPLHLKQVGHFTANATSLEWHSILQSTSHGNGTSLLNMIFAKFVRLWEKSTFFVLDH